MKNLKIKKRVKLFKAPKSRMFNLTRFVGGWKFTIIRFSDASFGECFVIVEMIVEWFAIG